MEDEDETEETEAVLKEFRISFYASLRSRNSMMKIEWHGFISGIPSLACFRFILLSASSIIKSVL